MLNQKSEYARGQYPGYLTPDGTWRYGVNAKKIAETAWANRDRPNASGIRHEDHLGALVLPASND